MTTKQTLRPIHPSAAIAAQYHKRLQTMVDAMHKSLAFWLHAAYLANEPEMAADAAPIDSKTKTASQQIRKAIEKEGGPAKVLLGVMRQLGRRWQKKFDNMADEMAEYFATEVSERVDGTMRRILRDAGWTVKFKLTKAQRDVLNAVVAENVQLIKSIPQQHLGQVEGLVMRSVQTGRDVGGLTKELHKRYEITKRRAAFIARQENNKATAILTRVRQVELGIKEAKWLHSHAGKTPRPSHVAFANGKDGGPYYDVAKGMWDKDEGRYVFPGELFNCRCISRSVIPGLKPKSMAQDASWMESQHPRDANGQFAKVSGGVTHPKAGTTTAKVWTLAHQLSNKLGKHATKKEVAEAAKELGLNPATVATQYHL